MGIYYLNGHDDSDYLEHHGILGMKWGVRRYQNTDGSLTPEGRERYYGSKESRKLANNLTNVQSYTLDVGSPLTGGTNKTKVYGYHEDYGKNSNLVRRTMRSPQMKAVAASVRTQWKAVEKHRAEMDKIEKQVCNKNTVMELARKAAESAVKDSPVWKGSTLKDAIEVFQQEDYKLIYGKNNRGDTYGFQWWLKNSGDPRAKAYLKEKRSFETAYKAYLKDCKKALDEFLGYYSKVQVKDFYGGNATLSDKGQSIIDNIMQTWDGYENYYGNGSPVQIGDISRLLL